MAQTAFATGYAGLFPMKARAGFNVAGHVFVTVQAQIVLAFLFKVGMTAFAVLLVFVVGGAQRAGAEHALEIQIYGAPLQGNHP